MSRAGPVPALGGAGPTALGPAAVPDAPSRRRPPGGRATLVLRPLVLLGAAFGFGYALTMVAARFRHLGPLAALAVPLLPVLALAVVVEPVVGPVAVVLTFPAGASSVPGVPIQLVQVAVLVTAGLAGLRRLAAGATPLPWSPVLGWVAALLGWMLVALPSAPDRLRGVREVVLVAAGLVFACVVTAAGRTPAQVRRLMAVLVAMVAAVAATTPLGAGRLRAAFGGAVVNGRPTGIFPEPNQLGTFCATGALVAVGLTFGAPSRRGRVGWGVLSAVCLLGLLLSLSRGAWIGFLLGLLVLVAKLPEARRALALLAVPTFVAAAGFGAFAPSSPQVEVVGQRLRSIGGEKNPYDNRPAIWREARREVVADPLTGQGPGNFPIASSTATSEARTVFASHAHGLLLNVAAEDGLPAALVVLAFAGHLAVLARRTAARAATRADRVLVAALAAALTAVFGQGLVDYTLRNTVIVTTVFALVGALVAMARSVPAEPTGERP